MMVRRKLFQDLQAHLLKKEFSIITGARQTGKSTLLRQLEEYCHEQEIPVIFLNLENKPLLHELNQSPLNVLKFIPETDKRSVILVDEIQYLEDASNFLKLLFDEYSGKLKIVATGSSAFYIDGQFRDSLAGRKKLFQLHTCSFEEYLEIGGKLPLLEEIRNILLKKDYRSTRIDLLRIEFENYMTFGGYPAIITEVDIEEKMNRLNEIRDSFVKRDILEAGVQNDAAFYGLFRILAAQSGNLVNVNELASTLRVKNETIVNYLTILQKCFHIALIKPYARNLRKELTKMQKVFLMDTGMRNCLLNNFQQLTFREDKGELCENMIFRMLADKYGTDAIQFWRTTAGNEVDFVIPNTYEPKAIEVKYDYTSIKHNKLKIFTEAYPFLPLSFAWIHPFHEDFFRRSL
jgi:predicted AAA+ superfamily ATPase